MDTERPDSSKSYQDRKPPAEMGHGKSKSLVKHVAIPQTSTWWPQIHPSRQSWLHCLPTRKGGDSGAQGVFILLEDGCSLTILDSVSESSGSFENSYILENPRTPKPLTFSKNRLREAKNRSNTSPFLKKKYRFFGRKTFATELVYERFLAPEVAPIISNTVVHITATTNFPIKLNANNFPVWRKQIQSTLNGLDLDNFINGEQQPPSKLIADKDSTKPNPEYTRWFRQDQIILSAILGSCTNTIQPILSSADTSHEAWKKLTTSYASASRSRIISLKSKLAKNPKGTRSVAEFLHDMKSIADELALVQSPVNEEDLLIHILGQLGDEFSNITDALKVRDTPISYPELFDKLVDFERQLGDTPSSQPVITTVNYTQRSTSRTNSRTSQDMQNQRSRFNSTGQPKGGRQQWSNSTNYSGGNRLNRNSTHCHFCNIPGHETKDCRKLTHFLRDNNVNLAATTPAVPIANSTTSRPTSSSATWIFDSGASHHITSDRSSLHTLSEYGGPDEIILGDGKPLSISHTGNAHLHTHSRSLSLPDVLYVPKLRNNLISVAKLCKTNHVSVEFFPSHFFVKDLRTGARLMRGENHLDVYYANLPLTPQINSATTVSLLNWHHKLGHPSIRIFKSLAQFIGLNSKFQNFHWHSCSINKSHKLSFGANSFTASKPLELLYSDVWGPIEKSIDGFKYYVIFVDYHTKYVWLYPMKHKSDLQTLFPQFKRLVEKYFKTPLISIFTDNGGEYIGLLKAYRILRPPPPPHTPEQNGVAERRHRHIVETGLALLHYAHVPLSFWSHAFQIAVYLINRLPTPILNFKSPYDVIYGKSPTYNKLKSFGCLCYPWLRPYAKSKLHPRSASCIFLGYSSSKSAYKCFDPISRRLYHSRHVEFVEHIYPYTSKETTKLYLPTVDEFLHNNTTNNNNPTTLPTTTNPTPLCPTPPAIYHPIFKIYPLYPTPLQLPPSQPNLPENPITSPNPSSSSQSSISTPSTPNHSSSDTSPTPLPPRNRKPNPKYFNPNFINSSTLHPVPSTVEPTTHTQALKDPQWRSAMDLEFNALLKNGTWELVPPQSHKPIGCKWVFRVKRKPDGSIDKYKARLVAKGFHQQYGKDYIDTFSPVIKPVTIRTVLSIALSKNWPLRQLDVNNAFLHGHLQEEVYMTQPPGYVNPDLPNHVCKLHKSLYGLKQAPRTWYIELHNFLLRLGFQKSLADPSLFIYNHNNLTCYFLVYVDDIVLTGNDNHFLQKIIDALAKRFSIKDLGMLHHLLGIEVISTSKGLFLS
ncbi:hypothetical protein LXL04_030083 [Taraxacum kok-saghyz]